MSCPHCQIATPELEVQSRAIEGGRAYAQLCSHCGRTLAVRPRIDTDPPVVPFNLNDRELDRLRFVQWRLAEEIRLHHDTPPQAA